MYFSKISDIAFWWADNFLTPFYSIYYFYFLFYFFVLSKNHRHFKVLYCIKLPIKIDRRDFNRELRIRREQKTLRNKKYLASSYGLSIRAAILKQIIFESPPLETDNIINFIKKKTKQKKDIIINYGNEK